MQKITKKVVSVMMAFVCALSLVTFSEIPVYAASPIRGYTILNRNYTIYSDPGLKNAIGTLFGSDEFIINSIGKDVCRITYKITTGAKAGSSKSGYIKRSAILLASSGKQGKCMAGATTYTRPNGGVYGSYNTGEVVIIVGKRDDGWFQVIYSLDDGSGMKIGWTMVDPTKKQDTSAVVEKAISWATAIANDDSHGYSMANRSGTPDYDCSSFVCAAYKNAGIKVGLLTTPTMRKAFTKQGFQWIPISKVKSVSSLKRGDVLVNTSAGAKGHTEIYLGNKRMIGAHGNYDGKKGDSSGREISIVSYSNNNYGRGWHGVLRYVGK